jgi:hypothetical protein
MTLQAKIVCDNPPSEKLDPQTVTHDVPAYGDVGAAAFTRRVAILLAGEAAGAATSACRSAYAPTHTDSDKTSIVSSFALTLTSKWIR